MTKKNNGAIDVLKQNAWPLMVVIMGWIVGFALLQARVSALETKASSYPSMDYFSLKFQNVDEKLDSLSKEIKTVQNLVKK